MPISPCQEEGSKHCMQYLFWHFQMHQRGKDDRNIADTPDPMSTVALLFGRLYVISEEEEKNVFREKALTTGNRDPLYVILRRRRKMAEGSERQLKWRRWFSPLITVCPPCFRSSTGGCRTPLPPPQAPRVSPCT